MWILLSIYRSILFYRVDRASYAQERIWFDEQLRFNSRNNAVATYNIPFLYHLKHGQLSFPRLLQTFSMLADKHSILRTSLKYDQQKQYLKQIINQNFNYSLQETTIENNDQLQEIIQNEATSNNIFDLMNGKVFRCHLIYKQRRSNDEKMLKENDMILFNIHHSAFDGASMEIFIHDFQQAYTNGELERENELTYLDYAQYERDLDMKEAEKYWSQLLQGYDREKQFRLPYDYHIETSQRSGRGNRVYIEINSDLIHQMSQYANQMNISMFQLCLACFYVYLFKLTNDEDLCIGSVNSNRYRPELQSVIGMFVNLLPYRLKLDIRQTTFEKLIQYIQQLSSEILSYGYLPYQEIIKLHKHSNESSGLLPYVQVLLQYNEDQLSNSSDIILDNDQTCLIHVALSDSLTTKFDLVLSIGYTPDISSDKRLTCSFHYSSDLFKGETVELMSKRFEQLLIQLFGSSFKKNEQPLYELSLILPFEQQILHDLNETTTKFDYSTDCVHHLFVQQSQQYSQKVALILDEQCLTYAELLYYVQLVAMHLIDDFDVKRQEIICQCVERSIEMVISILAILMTGAIYCPLNPQHPPARLLSLVEDTQAKHIVVQDLTKSKFDNGNLDVVNDIINIEEIINENKMISDIRCLSDVEVSREDIAYVIFTSGSTGKPKGVSHFVFLIDSQLIPM